MSVVYNFSSLVKASNRGQMKCNIPLQQKLYYPLKHTIHTEIDASINNFLNDNPLVLKNENELQISAKNLMIC